MFNVKCRKNKQKLVNASVNAFLVYDVYVSCQLYLVSCTFGKGRERARKGFFDVCIDTYLFPRVLTDTGYISFSFPSAVHSGKERNAHANLLLYCIRTPVRGKDGIPLVACGPRRPFFSFFARVFLVLCPK